MLLEQRVESDQVLSDMLRAETARQAGSICLIPSENITSRAVIEAQASCLTNKYAEGYPGKRYYEGCQVCDEVESLCIERACSLFGAAYANVQPHSGSQANQTVLAACLEPKDTILGMDLACGGHLTHGFDKNFSGKHYKAVSYGVDREKLVIDYDVVYQLALQHVPKLIFAGYSSYSRYVDWSKMRMIADEVGAVLVADIAHIAGLVAAGVMESPMQHAHIVTTTTHKSLRGPRGGLILTNDLELKKKIDRAVMPGIQGGPMMHTIAAKAVCFQQAATDEFKTYSASVLENAAAMCKAFKQSGAQVISGGTDNHMMVLDVSHLGISGKEAAKKLAGYGIVVNYNVVPFDTKPIMQTSGIRVGTPWITSCGFTTADMVSLCEVIMKILRSQEQVDVSSINGLFNKVKKTYDGIFQGNFHL